MKRVIQAWSMIMAVGTASLFGYLQPEQEEIWEPIEIVETVTITPDPVVLLQNEVRYTAHWDEETYDDTVEISYQDTQLLMMVASAEALNQGTDGMKKVMEVILNRVESPDFPNTIQEVIYQSGQFESVTNGAIYKAEITPEVRQALAEVEKNRNADKDIVAFETSANGRTLEKYFDYMYTLEDHDFYQTKKN